MSKTGEYFMDKRWTIRGVSPKARKEVEKLHRLTGIPYGRLVSEAIGICYNQFNYGKTARLLDEQLFRESESKRI
jgi:hypothetical protein